MVRLERYAIKDALAIPLDKLSAEIVKIRNGMLCPMPPDIQFICIRPAEHSTAHIKLMGIPILQRIFQMYTDLTVDGGLR